MKLIRLKIFNELTIIKNIFPLKKLFSNDFFEKLMLTY